MFIIFVLVLGFMVIDVGLCLLASLDADQSVSVAWILETCETVVRNNLSCFKWYININMIEYYVWIPDVLLVDYDRFMIISAALSSCYSVFFN